MLTLIVARARAGAIGRAGDIPWHAPEDLKMFQRETRGGAIIMGRRTWDSLPVKPLKDRLNIVVSRNKVPLADHVVDTVVAAVALALECGWHRVYGIGGAGIYKALLPMADRLMITEVTLNVPDADAFFPGFDENDWRETARRVLRDDNPTCELRELIRK